MRDSIGGPRSARPSSRSAYQLISQSLPACSKWKGSPGLMMPIVLVCWRKLRSAAAEM